MGNLRLSGRNNITSPNGNSLAMFVDGLNGELQLKDVMGNIEPLSNYTGCISPFEYNANATGIQPVLGTNNASGCYATIGGGRLNNASNYYSTINGGSFNNASANRSTIGGGNNNTASGCRSSIVGGTSNVSSGYFSTINGGQENVASARFSNVIGGLQNNTNARFSIIGGGNKNIIQSPTNECCSLGVTIGGGIGHNTVGGTFVPTTGLFTVAPTSFVNAGKLSTISGGLRNCGTGAYSTIGGGCQNTASGLQSSILGGCNNNTCGFANAMIIGSNLCATQCCTTFMNCVSANNLTVGCLVCVGANKVLENLPVSTTVLNYGLFSQTSNSVPVTATIVESSLLGTGVGTLSVPANGFSVGDSFTANMSGMMSAKNNDTITIRVKSGSVILADSGALTLPSITNQVWNLTLSFTIRTIGGVNVASIVTFGELHILKFASGTQEGFGFNTINNTTFDTTIPNTLDVTAEWSSNSALNSIYTDIFVLTKIF